jgi:rubrerythrin
MEQSEEEINQLTYLIRHEETLGQLYLAFATEFPDFEGFWKGISIEEDNHARWIRALNPKIKEGKIAFDKERFATDAIQTSIDYINSQIKSIQQHHEITILSAASIGLDLEKAMIDNAWFEVFKTDAPELQKVLEALAAATKRHAEKIEKLWKEIKANQQ